MVAASPCAIPELEKQVVTDLMPSRDFDALIAKKIIGWRCVWTDGPNGEPGCIDQDQIEREYRELPHFSTNISHAWEVVTKLGKWKFSLTWEYSFGGGGEEPHPYATAVFDPVLTSEREGRTAKADTAAHAICLAALKAVGGD